MVAKNKGEYNPCVPAVPPVISDFEVGEVILRGAERMNEHERIRATISLRLIDRRRRSMKELIPEMTDLASLQSKQGAKRFQTPDLAG